MERPNLTPDECAILIVSLSLAPDANEPTVASSLAQNYWHNHASNMATGDPLDIPGVRLEVLQGIVISFQGVFCPNPSA